MSAALVTIDNAVAAVEAAVADMLDPLGTNATDAWHESHRDVWVAAILDTGWSVDEAVAAGDLRFLLPESERERQDAERAAARVRSPWSRLTGDDVTSSVAGAALELRRVLVASAQTGAAAQRRSTPLGEAGRRVELPEMLPGDLADRLAYAHGLTVLFGEPESGKSFVAQKLGVDAMATGRRVIHLDYEQGPDDAGDNYRKLGCDPAEAMASGLLHYEYVQSDDPVDFTWLAAQATESPGLLVIVDSFARATEAAGISGTAYMEQGNLANAMQALGMRHSCAVLAIDHTVKKPKKGERYASGGPGKLGAARAQWFVVREKPFSPDRTGAITLTLAKSRAGGLAEWHRYEVGGEGIDRFSFRAVGGDVPVDRLERDILGFVETHGAGQSRNAIRKGVQGNDKAIDGATDTLVSRGTLRQDDSGRYPTFGPL